MTTEKKCECVECSYKDTYDNFPGFRYSKTCPRCRSDNVIELEANIAEEETAYWTESYRGDYTHGGR